MRRKPHSSFENAIHGFLFLMRVMTVLFIVILMTMIAPKKKNDSNNSSPVAGDLTIEAHWADSLDVDVDLWVKGPLDQHAVGYTRRSDAQFSYLRDDIGSGNDSTGSNYEFSFSRGLPIGLYIANLHMYSSRGHQFPIQVRVIATITSDGRRDEITSREIELHMDGEEVTAFTFEIDGHSALVPGSINYNFVPLRNPETQGGGME